MKMKAALMYGPNDIRIEMVDKPVCPQDGLILKIMAVGLCGSDIRNLTSDSRKGKYPFIYGHEIVGIVDEIGPKQTKYQVGDRLFYFLELIVWNALIVSAVIVKIVPNVFEKDLAGVGGFAQYVAVSGKKIRLGGIYQIPDYVSFEAARFGALNFGLCLPRKYLCRLSRYRSNYRCRSNWMLYVAVGETPWRSKGYYD